MIIGGLDIGTSNCKLSLYDGKRLLVQTVRSYAATREGGRHSLNANYVWNEVEELFREAVAREPAAAGVEAIAVSALGEAAVPVAADGTAAGEALLFWDESGAEEMEEIVRKLGTDFIQRTTGVIPHPMFTLCKMAWQKKHAPYFSRTKYFMLFEDFIIYRLTGERMLSYSLAGRTMGLDMAKRTWSDELFAAAGLDPAMMSPVAASGTPAGRVGREIAASLGLRSRPLVTVGGHDQMCVAVGAGAVREGIASNGSGTVEVMAVTVPQTVDPAALYRENYTLSIHADPDRLYTYSCNSTGSLLFSWFVENFGDGVSGFAEFEARSPASPTRLMVLPYVAGTGTPFMDIGAKATVTGVTLATTRYDIYRALMEGLSYDLAYNMGRIAAAGVDIGELRATGGGSQSRMWLQIKADMTGLPVKTLASHQAGAMGCMILAAVASGGYASVYEAVDDMVEVREVFEPDAKNNALYRERMGEFLALFDAMIGGRSG